MRTKSEPPADDDGDSSDGFCGGAPQNERHLRGLLKSLEREVASGSKATVGRRHLGKRTDLLRGQPLLDMEKLGSPTSSGRSGLAQHLFFASMHSTWSTSESENPSSTLNDHVKIIKKSSSHHATASSNGARGPAQASPTNGDNSPRDDANCGDVEEGAKLVLVEHGRGDDGVAALDIETKWSMATKMQPPSFETIDEISTATAANEARSASSTAAATDVPPVAFETISEGGSNPSSASCSIVDETESDPADTRLVEGLEAVAKKEADASGHHVWYSSSGSNSGSDGVAKNTNSQRKSTAKRQADDASNPDSSHFVWNSDSSRDSSLERTKLSQDKTRHGR